MKRWFCLAAITGLIVTLAVQHRYARKVRLRALAFQRNLQLHACELGAKAREMAAIVAPRGDAQRLARDLTRAS